MFFSLIVTKNMASYRRPLQILKFELMLKVLQESLQ